MLGWVAGSHIYASKRFTYPLNLTFSLREKELEERMRPKPAKPDQQPNRRLEPSRTFRPIHRSSQSDSRDSSGKSIPVR